MDPVTGIAFALGAGPFLFDVFELVQAYDFVKNAAAPLYVVAVTHSLSMGFTWYM